MKKKRPGWYRRGEAGEKAQKYANRKQISFFIYVQRSAVPAGDGLEGRWLITAVEPRAWREGGQSVVEFEPQEKGEKPAPSKPKSEEDSNRELGF